MKPKPLIWTLAFILLSFSGQAIISQIINVGSANGTDNYVREQDANANYGALQILETGLAGVGAGDRLRTLINLNFSINGTVNASATINTLILELEVTVKDGGSILDTHVFPLNKSWAETTVTWNNYDPLNMSVFNGTKNLATSVSSDAGVGQRFNITIDQTYAQRLFDGTLGAWDKGLMIINPPAENVGAQRIIEFASSDAATATTRWSLYINWTSGGGGGGGTLSNISVNTLQINMSTYLKRFASIFDLNISLDKRVSTPSLKTGNQTPTFIVTTNDTANCLTYSVPRTGVVVNSSFLVYLPMEPNGTDQGYYNFPIATSSRFPTFANSTDKFRSYSQFEQSVSAMEIEVPDSSIITKNHSKLMWFARFAIANNITALDNGFSGTIFNRRNNEGGGVSFRFYTMRYDYSSNKTVCELLNSSAGVYTTITTSNTIPRGITHSVLCWYDNTTSKNNFRMYILNSSDFAMVANTTIKGGVFINNSQAIFIGSFDTGTANSLNASLLDEVGLINESWDNATIEKLMRDGIAPNLNYSRARELNRDRNCTTSGGTTHICPTKADDAVLYGPAAGAIACQNTALKEDLTSTSGVFFYNTTNALIVNATDSFDATLISNLTGYLTNKSASYKSIARTSDGLLVFDDVSAQGNYTVNITSNQSGGYFTRIIPDWNLSKVLQTQLWQAVIYVNASQIILGDLIQNFGIRTNGSGVINLSNSTALATLRLKAGTYTLFGNSTPYINLTTNFTINNLEEKTMTLEFFSILFRANATNVLTGDKINVFNLYLTKNGTTYSANQSITNGMANFTLIDGAYVIEFASANLSNQTAFFVFDNGTSNLPNYTYLVYRSNTINLSIFDEFTNMRIENTTLVTIQFTSDITSSNYTTRNGSLYVDLLAPADYRITYSADKYRQRNYYFTLSNNSFNSIKLYLLSITNGTLTTFTITDQLANGVSNLTLKAQRYFVSSNSYDLVAMAKTDANGQAEIDLEHHTAFYKFLVVDNMGKILTDTVPSVIFSTTYPLKINTATLTLPNIFNRELYFSNLSFSNITNTFTFTYNDAKSVGNQVCLLVHALGPNSQTEICNVCSSSASSTLVCAVPDTNQTFIAEAFSFKTTNNNATSVLLDVLTITPGAIVKAAVDIFRNASQNMGIMVGFFITLAMVLIGSWNPIVSMMLGTFGFIGSYMAGFITLGAASLEWMVGIVIIVGILAYRARA